jgi:hypothetical protein
MSDTFEIKDSGNRAEFGSGMVRDTAEGKINFLSVRFGPMLRRWAAHCTNGRVKYPDPEPGIPNWTLAEGPEELNRFRESAARHFEAWLAGERDEDHAAGVFFNINGAEYVRDKMEASDFNELEAASAADLDQLREEWSPHITLQLKGTIGPDYVRTTDPKPWRIINAANSGSP